MNIIPPPIEERIDILDTEKFDQKTIERHILRYEWAASVIQKRFVRAGRVIDYACGTGYGSAILASVCHEVYGRDKSAEAIKIATERHSSTLVNFKVRDRIERHFADRTPFDAVVSIETIEHLLQPGQFLKACSDLIIPNGLLILSTPEKSKDGAPDNPFHLIEYSRPELEEMVKAHGFDQIEFNDYMTKVLPGFIFMTARRMP
jgi:SAM-dependent methyltransferase